MSIGGYNQLSITSTGTNIHSGAYRFQSARAGLYAYLKQANVKIIYIPDYICYSIIPAIKELDIEIKTYAIDVSLMPTTDFSTKIECNSRILVVNYFGLLHTKIEELISNDPEKFIVDNSQSLFSPYLQSTTTIYSPRKFIAVPDGGFLYSTEIIEMPIEYYDASNSFQHLVLRAAGQTDIGYQKFIEAETALEDFTPKRMSKVSEFLVGCNNFEHIKKRRTKNFHVYQSYFIKKNKINFDVDKEVPLCYPLVLEFSVDNIVEELRKKEIFTPRYWHNINNGVVGQNLFRKTIFLPIDERLSIKQVNAVCHTVSKLLDSI
jgi:hypothetical protein